MPASLLEQKAAVIARARAVAEKAKSEGRNLTNDEVKVVNDAIDEAKALDAKAQAAKESEELLDRLGSLDPDGHHPETGGSTYLDLSAQGRKNLAANIARVMTGGNASAKALLPTGEFASPIPVTPSDPIAQGKTPTSLLSVLPLQRLDTPTARYLRQQTRTNLAAAIPAGSTKPTSVYGLVTVDVVLRTYAHLSEPVDRFLLEDANSLATFLANELTYGVFRAVEADCINGAPAGANIVGMLQVSGIRTQGFDTDLLTTIRAAITTAQTTGYDGDLVLGLSAADWAAAETAKASTSGNYLMSGPPSQGGPKSLFGVPALVVTGLPANTAVLLDRPCVLLYGDRAGVRTDVGTPNDTWSKNEVVCRTEGRFDLGILQPEGICKITTAAVGP